MEIGSEYSWPEEWIAENKKEETGWKESLPYSDRQMVFSGRTALEYILKEIGNVKKAVLPSYCCESMIQPFLHAGIKVSFYPVEFVNGTLDILLEIEKDVDVVFWCNYFGFFHEFPEEILKVFQSRGGIVIEDITHSFLSEKQVHTLSDYFFVSLRKWGPMVCGGVAYKRKGKFSNQPLSMPEDWFLEMKKDAMKRKASYLSREKNKSEKAVYLNEFGKTNDYFDQFYRGKGIDETSKMLLSVWCRPGTFVRRRENAETIYEILTETKGLYFLFPRQAADCPLFIPIIINHNQRDQLKKRLAERKIYCPNHWPKPSVKGADSNLYDQELSLICDQRYKKEEIETMAKAVKEEFEILNLTKSNRGGILKDWL